MTARHPVPGADPVIALVGCGAIAQAVHAPALARHPGIVAKAVFVDSDGHRARELATAFGAGRVATRVADVLDEVHGAIVAVPHRLHATVCREFLSLGVHVLCEKPLAGCEADLRDLVATAAANGAVLAVNNMRRVYPASREIRRLLRAGAIGALRRIDIAWGEKFDWDAASGFYFGAAAGGRGVLLDRGAHVLDLACWWMGGRPALQHYADDSFGGAEATCELRAACDGCVLTAGMSWLSQYANQLRLEGEGGVITAGIYDWRSLTLTLSGRQARRIKLAAPGTAPRDITHVVMENFLDVVRGTATPLVAGADIADSIALMEACYARRVRFPLPWHETYSRVLGART